MKRGKDEEKILEPMFPRLHVNDADKRGPRAPPRNKMALYEQLSIPSQRSIAHGTLPLNSSSNTSTLLLPRPSTQPFGIESNLPAQHQVSSSASGHATQKFASQLSFMENVTSLALHDQRKLVREEDDFAVPVFINSSRFQCHGRIKNSKHNLLVASSSRHSVQFQQVNPEGLKHEVRDQVKQNAKPDGFVNSLDLSVTEEMDVEKSLSSCDRVNDCNAPLRQEFRNRLDRDGAETCVETHNGIESHLAPESHSEQGDGSPDDVDNGCEYRRSTECASLQQQNEEASDGGSDNSMVDSICSIDVSPDDVLGVLGQKRFWRARKAIANQQRVFAVQLFELHRLIKVQRLIAASPDLLLDDANYLGKVSAKSYPVKKFRPSEFMVKPPLPQVITHRSESEKTEQHKMECSAENVVGRLPNQGHHQLSNYMPDSPTISGCCFPPQPSPSGNQQWLIPVMSPSEGLIYKPHPGVGQTGPVCGGYYGHYMPTPMLMGGPPPLFHPGVGFPSPGNAYFHPYGIMPTMMNPYCSGQQQPLPQPNEQVNPGNLHIGSALNTQQRSFNETQQQPTKCYPRVRKSRHGSTGSSPSGLEAISGNNSFRPFATRDGEDNINNAPKQMMATTTNGGVTRVIKVVPHNAKLASENAARIFRSIQEERKHYESFSNP